MHELGYALLAVALVCWIITRQVIRRPVTAKRLLIVPLGLTILAATSDHEGWKHLGTPVALAFFAVGLLVAVAMGLVRATTVRVWHTDDGYVAQGGWQTVLLWLATIAVRVALALVARWLGANETSGEIMIFVALTLAAQNVVLAMRAGLLGTPRPQRATPTRR